ncbi:F-box/LRR-repeat protein 5-like isoform X1 [Panulirus ornatus]|uniref:F-box/LRR-repeat protein 5-like isoform X1 n=2 Tax=Panulirus ornatus TaxID=150431 RepID=UPI003A8BA3A6
MAPRYPDEIDVFTGPHSRMKELVDIYTQKMQCVDFRDGPEVLSLLQDLDTTLYEFKSHESIENIFIMDELKNRLKQRQILNTAVCDCHNDNRLSDIVQLVRTGSQVRDRSIGERISFGLKLQEAFEEFVQNFLPHMEEEEQVFQPLLVEYFDYDELKILKEVVLKEHELVKERQCFEKAHEEEPETSGIVKDLRDLDWDLCSLAEPFHNKKYDIHSEVVNEEESWIGSHDGLIHESTVHQSHSVYPEPSTYDMTFLEKSALSSHTFMGIPAPGLPTEILVEIFQHLTPPDLGRCAQVCTSWNSAVFSPSLWNAVYPVQWARGIWKAQDVGLCHALEDAALARQSQSFSKWDEDADIDEAEEENDAEARREYFIFESLVNWVLPRVGQGVSTIVVDAGRGISSRLLHQALLLCPNLTSLSAAHTQIDCYSFKGLWLNGSLQKLRYLDLQGCEMIDDVALEYLAQCAQCSQCPAAGTSECSSRYLNQYFEVPEDAHDYNNGYTKDESWTNSGERETFQYSGYCNCWCAGVSSLQLTNLPWKNGKCHKEFSHYSIEYPCQIVKKQSNVSRAKAKIFKHPSPEQNNMYPFTVQRTVVPSFPSFGSETDIEEICCRPKNSVSWDIVPGNIPCRKSAYPLAKPTLNGKQMLGNCSHHLQLISLNLSGCWQITDEGLLAMASVGILDNLRNCDVSGCYQLTGEGLEIFTNACPTLQPENLWYCDNIEDGPYPTLANGCANLCNPIKVCCRSGR